MAIYLKFGNIKGNATAKGFEKQIAVDSATFDVDRAVSMESGNLSNRESAKPTLSPITLVKRADGSIAALFRSGDGRQRPGSHANVCAHGQRRVAGLPVLCARKLHRQQLPH